MLTDPASHAPSSNVPPGDMPIEEFRSIGYQVIDWIADYLDQGPRAPVFCQLEPGDVANRLPEKAPIKGEPIEDILGDFGEIIYPGFTHWNSPRYMAYFPSSASGPAILGELLAAATSQNAMAWRTSPASTELELRVLEWFRDMLGLPADFHGHIVDTASIATMLALAAAREAHSELQIRTEGMAGRSDLPALTIYTSEEAHSSVDKAAATLGFGLEHVRKISTDNEYRMIPEVLHDVISADLADGFHPLAVVATVGTTSSTSIDPIAEIADVCREFNVWLHVDAAYAGVAALVPEKRHILNGCDRADSIVINPHKWLFTPVDCSTFFVRRPEILKAAFSLIPEYLSSERDNEEAVTNLMDYGIQLGRRFRSLKLWMVLRYFGADGLAERLRYHMKLADNLAEKIQKQPGVELMAPVNFATVCFRFRPDAKMAGAGEPEAEMAGAGEPEDKIAITGGKEEEETERKLEELNSRVMAEANASGNVFLSHTKLKGKYTLRLVFGHLRTTQEDVDMVWDLLTDLAKQIT